MGFTTPQKTEPISSSSTDKSEGTTTRKQEWVRRKLSIRRPTTDKTHAWPVRLADGPPPALSDDEIVADNIFASVTGLSMSKGNYYDACVPVPDFETVVSVMKGSPASVAGILGGDRLLRVGNKDVIQVAVR